MYSTNNAGPQCSRYSCLIQTNLLAHIVRLCLLIEHSHCTIASTDRSFVSYNVMRAITQFWILTNSRSGAFLLWTDWQHKRHIGQCHSEKSIGTRRGKVGYWEVTPGLKQAIQPILLHFSCILKIIDLNKKGYSMTPHCGAKFEQARGCESSRGSNLFRPHPHPHLQPLHPA